MLVSRPASVLRLQIEFVPAAQRTNYQSYPSLDYPNLILGGGMGMSAINQAASQPGGLFLIIKLAMDVIYGQHIVCIRATSTAVSFGQTASELFSARSRRHYANS